MADSDKNITYNIYIGVHCSDQEQKEKRIYADGYVSDPIDYAIKALEWAESWVKSSRITFALMALKEYQNERQTDNE